MAKMQRSSTNAERHPYEKLTFWENNQFWETPMYTEKAKEYFRKSLIEMRYRERRYTSL